MLFSQFYRSTDHKYGGIGLISEKMEVLYVELNERTEAATKNFSSI